MKKYALLSALSVSLCCNFCCGAFAQGTYVRKPLPAPDFFVPQEDIQYQEKLPPFPQPELPSPQIEQIEYSAPEIPKFQPVQSQDKPKANEPEFNPNLDVELNSSQNTSEKKPKYTQEYDAYLKDLNTIAQTGKAPYNSELDNDLSALADDSRIDIKNSRSFSPQSFNKLQDNSLVVAQAFPETQPALVTSDTKIIDTVEVLNIPKSLQKPDTSEKPVQEEKSASTTISETSNSSLSTNDDLNNKNLSNTGNKDTPNLVVDSITSPEVAAYFRGTNPFIAPDPIQKSENEHKVLDIIEENSDIEEVSSETEKVLEAPDEDEQKPILPLNSPDDSNKSITRSFSSSKPSFGLGPNMVR